ncbi:MAG: NAD(P)-binding protein [Cyanobacteria bacterium P01_E01_bin.35]
MIDYLIIGGGITGITLARLLQQKNQNNFLVLEAGKEPGGLCRTEKVGEHYLDTGGGHFLCSKYPEVYDFIFAHIAKSEFNYFPRVSKIELENEVIDYPVESNLWQLSTEKKVDYLISAILAGEANDQSEPSNYLEWIRWKLGDRIAEFYMLPYNEKIWGVNPNEMDIDWLHKIPSVNTKEIVLSCLERSSDTDKFPSHQGFYYPKQGGFQVIFDAIYQHVADQVRLSQPVTCLEKIEQGWLVNNQYEAKVVINTAPWTKLYQALAVPEKLEDCFDKLRSNSIVVSLWEEEYEHDWHWCYIPDSSARHHREFYIHNFAPHSQSNGLYTETNYIRWENQSGSYRFNSKPIYEHTNEIAYPIPTLGHDNAIKSILDYYQTQHLFGVGRWGQWKYFNSDVCMREAMKFVEGLFN